MKVTCLRCALGEHDECGPIVTPAGTWRCSCCGRRALARDVAFGRTWRGVPLDHLAAVAIAIVAGAGAAFFTTSPASRVLVLALAVAAPATVLISRWLVVAPRHRRRRAMPSGAIAVRDAAAAGSPIATRRRPPRS